MAEKKTIQLDVNTNAEQVGNQFGKLADDVEKLNQAEKNVNKTNKDLHASFEEVYGEVKPLTGQMGEMEDRLYQMALAGDQATDEFKELLTEVGKYKKVQIDTDLAVDAAAGTMSQKLGGALQGATSGFAVAQGAMGLFGTESEAVEKTILKVQSAMAIAEGVSGLREGAKSFKLLGMAATKAFKGMKVGLAATGIGLFVVALGVVVAYWDDIANAIGLANDELEESKALQEKLHNDAVERFKATERSIADIVSIQGSFIKGMHKEVELMEVRGATDEEIAEKRINAMEAEVDMLKEIEKKRHDDYIEASKNTKIGSQEYENALAKMRTASGNLFDAEHKLEVQRQKDHNAEMERIKEQEAERKANRERRRARFITQRDDRLAFERELEDLKLAQMVEGQEKETKLLNLQYDRIREDIKNNEKLNGTQKRQLIEEQEKIRQQELFRIRRDFGAAEKGMELRKATEIETAKTEIIIDAERIRNAEIERLAQERREKAKENAAIIAQMSIDGLRLVSDVAELFAGKSEKAARRAFNIKKTADLADATMSGYKAVISTYANAPGGPVLKGIAAGIAGGFAALQIGKIASAQFQGGDQGGDLDTDIPSPDITAAAPTPQFNVVGDSGINQLAELQQQPTKAFVVSGEVTTAQSLDRNRINNATI